MYVTDMSDMFTHARHFNQPVDVWNVSKVTSMHAMFSYAARFNQPLNSWHIGNVTNMSEMFQEGSINLWTVGI